MGQSQHFLEWVSDWADKFDQAVIEEDMRALIGNIVSISRSEEQALPVSGVAVGFGKDTLVADTGEVCRWSVVLEQGVAVHRYYDTVVQIVEQS